MHSEDRLYSIAWGFLSAALVIIVFFVSSCQIQQDKLSYAADAKIKQTCIMRGGNWTDVSKKDSTAEYGCVLKQ